MTKEKPIKKINLLLIIFGIICTMPTICCAVVGENWIEQYGIRWTFDKNVSLDGAGDTYHYGQFVNGDYWVVGPVNIVSISPYCHITVEGEQDESGSAYNSFPFLTGNGAWSVTENWYRHTTIYTSDTSKLSVGQVLLINGTTGADSAKVNGYTGTVQSIYSDRFILSFYPLRWDLKSTDDISGGVFGGRIINGSQINPLSINNLHGYDSNAHGYDHSKNAAWHISNDNSDKAPFVTVPEDSSLISTGSRKESGSGNRSNIQRAQILTVLTTAPPADSFRPHYFGTSPKLVMHNKNDIDNLFLGNLPLFSESHLGKPVLSDMIDKIARPWVRLGKSHVSSTIHPYNNMPEYYFQIVTNDVARVLNSSDYTLEQKQPLLINFIQLGIDLFGQYAEGSQGNGPDGGIYMGLMLPMLAFGRALNHQPVWDMFAKAGDYRYSPKPGGGNYSDGDLPPDYNFIQELCQTFYITQRDVDISHNLFRGSGEYLNGIPLWNPDARTAPNYRYTTNMIGIPEWGIRQATSPNQSDAAFPNSNYRSLNSSRYSLIQIAILVWGLKDKVNHPAFFDYTDRWVLSQGGGPTWTAYRSLFGPLWEPGSMPVVDDPNNPGNPNLPSGTIPEITELKVLNNVLKAGVAYATVKLMLSESGNASVKIYDTKGRDIICLWDGYKEAGEHPFAWDGTDSSGKKVGSGVYMVHMKSGSYKETKKIVVVK